MHAIRIEITGRVQGVGFRAFVCRRAALFGVSGEVWNRGDGSVEALAYHLERDVLDTFAGTLKSGPGRVEYVKVSPDSSPDQVPDGFSIAPTRG